MTQQAVPVGWTPFDEAALVVYLELARRIRNGMKEATKLAFQELEELGQLTKLYEHQFPKIRDEARRRVQLAPFGTTVAYPAPLEPEAVAKGPTDGSTEF